MHFRTDRAHFSTYWQPFLVNKKIVDRLTTGFTSWRNNSAVGLITRPVAQPNSQSHFFPFVPYLHPVFMRHITFFLGG